MTSRTRSMNRKTAIASSGFRCTQIAVHKWPVRPCTRLSGRGIGGFAEGQFASTGTVLGQFWPEGHVMAPGGRSTSPAACRSGWSREKWEKGACSCNGFGL